MSKTEIERIKDCIDCALARINDAENGLKELEVAKNEILAIKKMLEGIDE